MSTTRQQQAEGPRQSTRQRSNGQAVLGISAFYHDSAAAILVDGKCIAAAQEERFTRRKHDASFPINAIQYVLEAAGITYEELAAVAFYEKPLLKFERILDTVHAVAPKGLLAFLKAMPIWLKEKLYMRSLLRRKLSVLGKKHPPFLFPEHHLSHAASAFYPSPFEEAAILTIDGVGEWTTTTIAHGKKAAITLVKEGRFPHSIGLLYSAFTTFLGFEVNDGEYKLMGLAAYGDPASPQTKEFREKITTHLVDIREDGSILLNTAYFAYITGLKMVYRKKWESLFNVKQRPSGSPISQDHMNLALAIQQVTETIIITLAHTAQTLTGCKNLVLAGGVALNCVANARLAEANIFERIWIQPAAGDAGGSLGAASAAWHLALAPNPEQRHPLQTAYLGPAYTDNDVHPLISRHNTPHRYFTGFDDLAVFVAKQLAQGKVIGWFQDRMEFGPRALGNRSILADPGNPSMQKKLNEKIKFRESFRPFAPAILEEDASQYFAIHPAVGPAAADPKAASNIAAPALESTAPDTASTAPDTASTAPATESTTAPSTPTSFMLTIATVLATQRSTLPAVTHLDYTARVQTVTPHQNEKFSQLLREFKKLTGYGILINTSFNVKDEPIVCTPEDAWRCFTNTNIDGLVIGNYYFDRITVIP
jgi:carbamoyltransferase